MPGRRRRLPGDANPIGAAIYADAVRVILTATGTGATAGTDVFGWAMWGYVQ